MADRTECPDKLRRLWWIFRLRCVIAAAMLLWVGRLGGVDCVAHYICACIAAAVSLTPLPVAALAFLRSYRTLLPPLLLLQ